jgi:hypothetical protein
MSCPGALEASALVQSRKISSEELNEAKHLLWHLLQHPDELLSQFNFSQTETLMPIRLLGVPGASGSGFEVTQENRTYVLKTFSPLAPVGDVRRAAQMTELKEAVIIQHVLATLKFAPKVHGQLSGQTIKKWIQSHFDALQAQVSEGQLRSLQLSRAGLLMEKVPGISTKNPVGKIRLTKAAVTRALDEALEIDRVVQELDILARDIDLFINTDGAVEFIDLSWFDVGPKIKSQNFYAENQGSVSTGSANNPTPVIVGSKSSLIYQVVEKLLHSKFVEIVEN